MASLNGINTNMALDFASTWGTATSLGAGDKLQAEVTYSDGGAILSKSSIGSGNNWGTDAQRGTPSFSVSVNWPGGQGEDVVAPGYGNGFDKCTAHFFGATAAPAEQTGGQGDYLHRITFATALNTRYLTLAAEEHTSGVAEFPTMAAQSWSFTAANPTAYASASVDMIADTIDDASPTNNNAAVQATTFSETECIVVSDSHEFLINAQSGGALSSPGDRKNITSFSLVLNKPQEATTEIKGSAGLGVPNLTGPYTGILTVIRRALEDDSELAWWRTTTPQKSNLTLEGSQIGTGVNHQFQVNLPHLRVLQRPEYSPNQPGTNPLTVTFKVLGATVLPTGMADLNTYIDMINERATQYIS